MIYFRLLINYYLSSHSGLTTSIDQCHWRKFKDLFCKLSEQIYAVLNKSIFLYEFCASYYNVFVSFKKYIIKCKIAQFLNCNYTRGSKISSVPNLTKLNRYNCIYYYWLLFVKSYLLYDFCKSCKIIYYRVVRKDLYNILIKPL